MLLDYLDRVSIIHLPQRTDRYRLIEREMARAGLPLSHPKVDIPFAPMVDDAGGFSSRGVHGNFLSHMSIIRDGADRGDETIMVVEDDAIFRHIFARPHVQDAIVAALRERPWGMCFLGHPLRRELAGRPAGLIGYDGHFIWAHAYLVHRSAMRPLADYLQETMDNRPDDPRGHRMYIDGAFNHFRDLYPQHPRLVANPSLSIQGGSPSSLAEQRVYDRVPALAGVVGAARAARDELWRRSLRGFPAGA